MKIKRSFPFMNLFLILTLVQIACSFSDAQPTPTPTNTPQPTATLTLTPTNTPRPSPTPRPTRTPNLAATQRIETLNAETQSYFDKGYLTTTDGSFKEFDNFSYDWAQLHYYNWLSLGEVVSDFYLTAHFKWSSAYRNADVSGCGFIFAIQDNGDHYAVFLDRSKILFLYADQTAGYSRPVGLTRGSGQVKFGNPGDSPQEADFTVIVKGVNAYVVVNQDLVGQYTLAQSKILRGDVGLSVLSGTNKGYGTRCEMTNIHLWKPKS